MNSPSSSTSFVAALEAEYRQLSTEARKTEGFAGLFTSTDHPEIKEAAEKALLRIRSLADVPDANTQLAQCRELFRPLQLAADTRSPRLAGQALATAQKLLANSAASAEGAEAVLGMLTSAARLSDERVQLKCLQTALTLLQSPLHPITSAALGPLLGVCFGFLAAKGFKSTVTTTAAATVRQALALLLSYIREGEVEGVVVRVMSDLCSIAAGGEPVWLQTPSLLRTQVLELLDFVLATSPTCFMDILGLQPIVAQTMPDLLRPQLQDHLDAGVAASAFATAHFPTLRAALRCVRTLLGTFHCQLGAGAGPLVQSLLSGLQAGQPNFQRVAVLHAVVLLLGDGPLLAWLGAKYDHDKASRSEPVRSLAEACLLVLESVEKGRDAEDDPLPAAMARALLGRPGSLEPDPGTGAATAAGQRAALAALALEGMSAFAVTLEGLAGGLPAGWDSGEGDAAAGDAAATTLPNAAASDAAVHDTATTEPGAPSADDVLRTLLDSTWKPMLDTLRRLLSAGPLAPPLLQELLKAHQSFAIAAGLLQCVPARDAFLTALCDLALAEAGPASADPGGFTALGLAATRALLATAHRLSRVLGPGWGAVLSTLAALDRRLAARRRRDGGGAAPGPDPAAGDGRLVSQGADLEALAAALAALYASSACMERGAVLALVTALREVSLTEVPGPGSLAQPRLLALGRMTDVLLANTQRLQDLWAVFLSHVLEVLAAAQPSARVVVVEALGRVVSGALARIPAAAAAPGGEAPAAAGAPPAPGPPSGLEHMLLVSLESVYGGEREPEVRRAVLRVLLSTLQRHGERLGGGWGAVFRLLAAVPEARDAAATDLGFQAVQLVAGDFAAGLGAARLRRCLEVAAVYGAQQEDVNVSLTTISLLWNVADLVGRAAPGSEGGAPGGGTEEEAVSPGAGLRLTQEEGDVILELIFSALQGLASDPRPEVRNSGLRTLFAVVMSQGGRLSRARWEACLWDMLFPLLRHAFHMSVTSSREESGPAALGRSRGETVHLVVHHSHNSEAKQWDETVVLALGGMGRLLRAHLTLIVTLDQGEAGWEEMMVVIESCMAGARKRVALAAVGVLGSLLAAHGGRRDVLGEAAWARAVRAVEVGVEAAANPTCRVPLAVRLELVGLAGAARGAARARGDAGASLAVHRWLERCARHPWSDDDASNGGAAAYGLPPVQKAVLAALPAIAPQPDEEELWIDFLATLARLLHPGQILEAARSAAGGEQRPEHPVVGRQVSAARLLTEGGVEVQSALSSSFLLQVLEALVRYYTPAPSGVRAATLAATVGCLGACMAVRHTVYDEALWRAAAKAFTSIVPQGLPALVAANDPKLEARAWAALADALELFLLGRGVEFPTTEPTPENGAAHAGGAGMEAATRDPGSIQMTSVTSDMHQASNQDAAQQQASAATAAVQSDDPDATAASAASDSELEAAVLDTLTDAILASAPSMPPPTLDRFVAIVDGGVCRPPWLARQLPHAGLGFSQACLRKLYVVAARYGAGGDGSRGGGGDGLRNGEGEEGQLPAAVAALRALLARCDHMVQAAVDAKTLGAGEGAAGARYGGPSGQPRLDEVLCMLEVLASLTLDPAVADALLDGADGQLRQLVGVARGCAGRRRERERTHLLLIYPALVQAVALQEPRLREMVRDVLQLAGAELGLGVAASPRAE